MKSRNSRCGLLPGNGGCDRSENGRRAAFPSGFQCRAAARGEARGARRGRARRARRTADRGGQDAGRCRAALHGARPGCGEEEIPGSFGADRRKAAPRGRVLWVGPHRGAEQGPRDGGPVVSERARSWAPAGHQGLGAGLFGQADSGGRRARAGAAVFYPAPCRWKAFQTWRARKPRMACGPVPNNK